MKRYLALFVLAALIIAAPAIAQEHAAQADTQTEFDVRAGVTPDSALYGLATAWERTQLVFTRNPERRAERALNQADKKLAEIEVLAERGQLERAERAEQRYEELMQVAAEALERLEEADDLEQANTSLEATSRARADLQVRFEHVLNVHERILERQEERMSEEQLERLGVAFERLNNATTQADNRLEESRERIKTRAKVLGNLSDEEADRFEAQASARAGLDARLDARAENILARMQERNERLLNETSNRSQVARERLEIVLNNQLERLAENFERRSQRISETADNRTAEISADMQARIDARAQAAAQVGIDARQRAAAEREAYQQRARHARGQAQAAAQDVRDAIMPPRPSDEEILADTRISVEVDETTAEVFVQTSEERSRFSVEATSREDIARAIASRLDVSYQEVLDVAVWSHTTTQRPDETRPAPRNNEIFVQVGSDESVVELNINGEQSRFVVESTSRAQVAAQIQARTGLSEQRVQALTEWSSSDSDARVEADSRTRTAVGTDGARVESDTRVGASY